MKLWLSKIIPIHFTTTYRRHVRGSYKTTMRASWWQWGTMIWAHKEVEI